MYAGKKLDSIARQIGHFVKISIFQYKYLVQHKCEKRKIQSTHYYTILIVSLPGQAFKNWQIKGLQ